MAERCYFQACNEPAYRWWFTADRGVGVSGAYVIPGEDWDGDWVGDSLEFCELGVRVYVDNVWHSPDEDPEEQELNLGRRLVAAQQLGRSLQ